MEKRINKMNAMIGAGINVNATQANNVNRNEELKDDQSNSYGIELKAELKDPEVTGSDTLDIKLEFPFGGRLEIKATSNVTSSVLAQQTLNEQARKNLETLGQFLASAAMAIAPAIAGIKETIREQEKIDDEVADENRRKNQQLDIELAKERSAFEHECAMEDLRRWHEKRMLEMQLNDEYNKVAYPEQNED